MHDLVLFKTGNLKEIRNLFFYLQSKSKMLTRKLKVPKWNSRISNLLNFLYYFWYYMLHFSLYKLNLFIEKLKTSLEACFF